MKRSEAKSLGQIITETFEAAGATDNYNRQRVCFVWADVVGPVVNRYTTRRYVDGRTMHVYISSAALKNELVYLTDRLVGNLNRAVGQNVIDKLIIH